MSIAAMKSSESKASPSLRPSGVESTGLPAMVTNARTWPVTGRLDLLAHARGRELAAVLRESADPAAVEVEVAGPDEAAAHHVDRRLGEHHPAGPVEVAGQEVEAVDRPLADRAEAGRGDAEPAVRRGAAGLAQLARQTLDGLGRHGADLLGECRGEARRRAPAARRARRRTPEAARDPRRGSCAASRAARRRRRPAGRRRARSRSRRSRCGAGRAPRSVRRAA